MTQGDTSLTNKGVRGIEILAGVDSVLVPEPIEETILIKDLYKA